MIPNGKLDPENIGMALGISLIYCVKAEIHAFEFYRPPSCIFHFRFGRSLSISSSGLLDPRCINLVAIAVGISYLTCLGAELVAFEVLRPLSWIIHFWFGCIVFALVKQASVLH